VWRIVIRYASPAPAACKGGSVQPAVVVHVVLVRRGRGMSDFRTGEWVSNSRCVYKHIQAKACLFVSS
jgi:hypothetical protein